MQNLKFTRNSTYSSLKDSFYGAFPDFRYNDKFCLTVNGYN